MCIHFICRDIKGRWGIRFTGISNPYAIDITEIDGFDNLHHAEGIIRESMDWAAKRYRADRSLLSGQWKQLWNLRRGLRDDPAWREDFDEPELP